MRENLSHKFPLLGYKVYTFSDIYEPIKELNNIDPDLVIIDVDENRRKWKIFASGLKLAKKKITIPLEFRDETIYLPSYLYLQKLQ